jgi:hypothetical protein
LPWTILICLEGMWMVISALMDVPRAPRLWGRGRSGNPSPARGDQPMTNRPCIHGWKAQRKYRIEPDGAVSVAPID